jgi:preprotein translocase subunit SecG
MMTLVLVLHFMVCFVLISVVLLQRGKGADLGASLGGGGANTVFGGRGAGNFLTKITTGSAILFMLTSLSLAYMGTQSSEVQIFEDGDGVTEEFLPGEEAAAEEAGGLEEIDPGVVVGEFEEVGGLEEIEPGTGEESVP